MTDHERQSSGTPVSVYLANTSPDYVERARQAIKEFNEKAGFTLFQEVTADPKAGIEILGKLEQKVDRDFNLLGRIEDMLRKGEYASAAYAVEHFLPGDTKKDAFYAALALNASRKLELTEGEKEDETAKLLRSLVKYFTSKSEYLKE